MVLNKPEIVNSIEKKTGLNKKNSSAALDAFCDTVKAAVKKHTTVRLTGFLTVKVAHRNSRQYRNPQSGKLMKTDPKDVPTIKPGQALRRLANEK